MAKPNVVSRVLAVISFVALSAAIAHAGGGEGGGGTSIEGYQCYFLERTVNQPHVVTLDDQFGSRTQVRVGNGRLLCTKVAATLESGTPTGQFDDAFPSDIDHIKCYDIHPLVRGPRSTVELTDPVDKETAIVSVPLFFCTFASKTVLP